MANESIGAIWVNKDKNGKTYWSWKIELDGKEHAFAIFKNHMKDKDSQPDYTILPSRSKGGAPPKDEDIPF